MGVFYNLLNIDSVIFGKYSNHNNKYKLKKRDLIMTTNIQNKINTPQEAIGFLKELIIRNFKRESPRHNYIQSYFTEELKMSEEEATERLDFSKLMFPTNPHETPPIFEESCKNNNHALIISYPNCSILTEYKGKFYTYPMEYQLYEHVAKKIADQSNLRFIKEIIADDKEGILSFKFIFSST